MATTSIPQPSKIGFENLDTNDKQAKAVLFRWCRPMMSAPSASMNISASHAIGEHEYILMASTLPHNSHQYTFYKNGKLICAWVNVP